MDFIFDPSLVLYLPLYELDGASFMSKDAQGHLCTVTGVLWRPDGRYFDGSDDYINCGNDQSLNFTTDDFTLEAWIKPIISPDGDALLAKGVVNSKGYYLRLETNGKYRLRTFQSGTQQETMSATGVFAVNVWSHIISVYIADKAGGNGGRAHLYANALDVTAAPGSHKDPADNPSGNFLLGSYPGFNYGGLIGEVRIYNRALAPQEIQHNYLATKWRYQ